MISAEGISFSYGKKTLFKDLSLCIEKGGFVTLLGPKGCGKSTLLKLLCGHLRPSSGSISLYGQHSEKIGDIERAKILTFVGQHQGAVFPHLCVDYVLLGRRPHRRDFEDFSDEDFEIAESAMRTCDVLKFADKHLNELSGGEFQRVVLAKALAQSTGCILLDEAFSAMDIYYSVLCLDELKRMVSFENSTVVCVMHDINLAFQYSDQVILMNNGRIHSVGDPDSVLTIDSIKEVYGISVEKIEGRGFLIKK